MLTSSKPVATVLLPCLRESDHIYPKLVEIDSGLSIRSQTGAQPSILA